MGEQQLFFSNNPTLFGLLYTPEKPNGKAVLILHPFAEEKKSSQRSLVEIAKTLMEHGCYVLLFDLRGCGDSDGDFSEIGIEVWMQDIAVAAELLRQYSKITLLTLVGLRMGSYLALLYGSSNLGVNYTILIEAILDPIDYLKKVLRSKLIKELLTAGNIETNRNTLIEQLGNNITIDFDGYPITGKFYQELCRHQEVSFSQLFSSTTTMLHVMSTKRIPSQKSYLIDKYNICRHEIIHMPSFWERTDSIDSTPLQNILIDLICHE